MYEYIDSIIIIVGTAVFAVVCVVADAIQREWANRKQPKRRRR